MNNWFTEKKRFFFKKKNNLLIPKKPTDRPSIFAEECLFLPYYVCVDPNIKPITNFHSFPHLTEVFDHPMTDKVLKTYKVSISQHYTRSKRTISAAKETLFFSNEQYCHSSQTECFAQLTQVSGFCKPKVNQNINSENEHIEEKNYFQRMFNRKKQIGEMIETYLAKNSETYDIEILKNVLHGYHAAHISCANSQLSLKTMQHASSELHYPLTLLKQVFTVSSP